MSRGLGRLQQKLKSILSLAADGGLGALTFAALRATIIYAYKGDPERDRLNPTFERSMKRALRTLVDRGDVLIVGGKAASGTLIDTPRLRPLRQPLVWKKRTQTP